MNTKPTFREALAYAKAHRFKAPSIRTRKALLSYIHKNVRFISMNSLKLHIKICLKTNSYPNTSDELGRTNYCSEIVSDIYNMNLFLREGRSILLQEIISLNDALAKIASKLRKEDLCR